MGKRAESFLFNRETIASLVIPSGDYFLHELHILIATLEVATATQQECLINHVLKVTVGRFNVTVLVGTTSIRPLRFHFVVLHQRAVSRRQLLFGSVIVDRCAEAVGAMDLGHTAELPKRFLDTFAECFERLRKTKGYGLHVRVRQHAMKQRVFKD
jgi:hypothetical protein